MNNYVCKNCHAYCDPGELRNGICIDCIEAEVEVKEKEDKLANLLSSESNRLEVGLI